MHQTKCMPGGTELIDSLTDSIELWWYKCSLRYRHTPNPPKKDRYNYVYHTSNLGIDNIIHKYCIFFSYDLKPVTIPRIVNTRTLSQTLTGLEK